MLALKRDELPAINKPRLVPDDLSRLCASDPRPLELFERGIISVYLALRAADDDGNATLALELHSARERKAQRIFALDTLAILHRWTPAW